MHCDWCGQECYFEYWDHKRGLCFCSQKCADEYYENEESE